MTVDKTRKQLLKSRTRKHTVEVKNKFDDAGVEEFVTIASKEEDKFEGSVSEYAAQLTKNPGLAAAQVVVQHQVQVRRAHGDEDRDHHQRGGEQLHREEENPGLAAAHVEVQHPGTSPTGPWHRTRCRWGRSTPSWTS